MKNSVIKLVKREISRDESGNAIQDQYGNFEYTESSREVFALAYSIGTGEFYSAATTDMKPEIKFKLSDYLDYDNESIVRYTPYQSSEVEYTVIRTYKSGNQIELTCQRKIANG